MNAEYGEPNTKYEIPTAATQQIEANFRGHVPSCPLFLAFLEGRAPAIP